MRYPDSHFNDNIIQKMGEILLYPFLDDTAKAQILITRNIKKIKRRKKKKK